MLFNNTNSPELIGKTTAVLVDTRLAYSNHMTRVRLEDGLNPAFIARQLHFLWMCGYFRHRCVNHVNQASISAEPLSGTVPILLPPVREQERIADALDELLSDLDVGTAALERVRQKLKLYRASALKAAVEGTLTAEWRKQHPHIEPASDLLKRILAERRRRWEEEQLCKFKEKGRQPPKNWKAKYREPLAPNTANLPELPERWCWATVDQLTIELMNGFGKRTQTGGSPWIVLRLADVSNGEISYKDVRRINSTDDETRKYALNENDLLILRVNGSPELVGRFVLVRKLSEQVLYCDHFIRARCVNSRLSAWLRTNRRPRGFLDLDQQQAA